MGSKDERKRSIGRSIPRNPNMPITDAEVDSLLKQAAEQISATPGRSDKKGSGASEKGKAKKTVKKEANGNTVSKKTVGTKATAGKAMTGTTVTKKTEDTKATAGKATTGTTVTKKTEDTKATARKAMTGTTVTKQTADTKATAGKAMTGTTVTKQTADTKATAGKAMTGTAVTKQTADTKVAGKTDTKKVADGRMVTGSFATKKMADTIIVTEDNVTNGINYVDDETKQLPDVKTITRKADTNKYINTKVNNSVSKSATTKQADNKNVANQSVYDKKAVAGSSAYEKKETANTQADKFGKNSSSRKKQADTRREAKVSMVEDIQENSFQNDGLSAYVHNEDVAVTGWDKIKAGIAKIFDIIGSILEGIWIGVKLVVLVAIITAVVGFFMSRDLMVRGRSGERLSVAGMTVSSTAASNKSESKELARTWGQNAKMTKLTLTADDGSILVARKIVTDKKSDKWAVILHGYNGSMEDIYDIAMRYEEEGYNLLMPDLRANGESEGSFYGMGWLDRMDVINWLDVILEENLSAQIVIHGVDIGADTALMMSGEPLTDSVKAIVAEGAYTSAWDVVEQEYQARHEEWPVFPIMHMMNPVMKIWAGYTLTEADAVKQVKNTSVPILLIRGQNDTYVSEDMTQTLDQAIASEHEVLTVATGTHDDNRFAEPDTYYDKTFEFVGRYVQ